MNISTLAECIDTYTQLGGTTKVFDYVQKHGVRFSVDKHNLPNEWYHNGELLTYCIQVAGEISEAYGYKFYTGFVSLNDWGLSPHCWNVDNAGILYDGTYQYREYLTVDRVYYGVATKSYCDIFTLVYDNLDIGNIYYHRHLYLWHKNKHQGTNIFRDWWNDYNIEICASAEELRTSEFTNMRYRYDNIEERTSRKMRRMGMGSCRQ